MINLDNVLFVFLMALFVNTLVNLKKMKPEKPGRAGALERWPSVSILVPVRNEERNIRRLLESLLRQDYPDYEIIVVDDGSTDRTWSIVQSLAERHPRLRAVQGEELPPEWTGKNWACHQLSCLARGEMLLFTDADTVHSSRALKQAVASARKHGSGLLSVIPTLEAKTWSEKLYMPIIPWAFVSLIPWFMMNVGKKREKKGEQERKGEGRGWGGGGGRRRGGAGSREEEEIGSERKRGLEGETEREKEKTGVSRRIKTKGGPEAGTGVESVEKEKEKEKEKKENKNPGDDEDSEKERRSWLRRIVRPVPAVLGPFLLLRRPIYEACGGHQAIRNELVDDLSLARRIIQQGERTTLIDGSCFLRIRFYTCFRELWAGFSKNSYEAVRGTPLKVAAISIAVYLLFIRPYLVLIDGLSRSQIVALPLLQVAAITLTRLVLAERFRTGWRGVLLHPLSVLLALLILINSFRLSLLRKKISWKERWYPVP